ncbi:hypothetical protein BH11PSE3_BH11PSE3_48600 [soil metagenome]
MGMGAMLQLVARDRRIALRPFDNGHDLELPGELLAALCNLAIEQRETALQFGAPGLGLLARRVRRQRPQALEAMPVPGTARRRRWLLGPNTAMVNNNRRSTHRKPLLILRRS